MIFSKLIKRRVASDGVPQLSQLEKVVVDNMRNVLLLLLFLHLLLPLLLFQRLLLRLLQRLFSGPLCGGAVPYGSEKSSRLLPEGCASSCDDVEDFIGFFRFPFYVSRLCS